MFRGSTRWCDRRMRAAMALDVTTRGHDEVDRAQIREHLRLTPAQRLENVENVAAFTAAARRTA